MTSLAWPHISVISVIDILLVAFLIYQFLVLVRGTRAAPMLVAVAALGLAFYFARLGELRTLNWLLSTLLPYVVFALIVVFPVSYTHLDVYKRHILDRFDQFRQLVLGICYADLHVLIIAIRDSYVNEKEWDQPVGSLRRVR